MTEPYYQDDRVTLYHGDCLDWEDEASWWLDADVLVTDPPYGIGWYQRPYKTKGRSEGWRSTAHRPIQNDDDLGARSAALQRWGTRPALVFGSSIANSPSDTKQTLVWRKPLDSGLFGTVGHWRRDWEPIFVLGGPWPHRSGTESSVLTSTGSHRDYTQGLHPHGKPIGLLEKLIKQCPQGVVADPFAGSGSTLVAARNLGRKAVGVEIEERYCELIATRLSQACFDFGEGA